jgi:predicted amidohydrolase
MTRYTNLLRVAAVQANASQCWTEKSFHEKVMRLTEDAAKRGAKIVAFPEDVGLWLGFVKESPAVTVFRDASMGGFRPSSEKPVSAWRKFVESASDWLFAHLRLPWLGDYVSQAKIQRVAARAFSAAASTYRVVVVGGSIFERREGGDIYATCRVYDADGTCAGVVEKHHLISIETSMGAIPTALPTDVVEAGGRRIGVCICYDLNFPDVTAALAKGGAELICCGSSGIRPYPGYPFNPSLDEPQVQRAIESQITILRPYQCGFMVPGIYFDGRSSITLPDGTFASYAASQRREEILIADVPLRP